MKSQSIALLASKLTVQGDSSHKKKEICDRAKVKIKLGHYQHQHQHQQCRAHELDILSGKKNELIDLSNGVNQMCLGFLRKFLAAGGVVLERRIFEEVKTNIPGSSQPVLPTTSHLTNIARKADFYRFIANSQTS